jgi:threonine dehydratase
MSRAKQVVEPAAAAPLAALLTGKTGTAHVTNTVAILSGGNIDLDRLKGLL